MILTNYLIYVKTYPWWRESCKTVICLINQLYCTSESCCIESITIDFVSTGWLHVYKLKEQCSIFDLKSVTISPQAFLLSTIVLLRRYDAFRHKDILYSSLCHPSSQLLGKGLIILWSNRSLTNNGKYITVLCVHFCTDHFSKETKTMFC